MGANDLPKSASPDVLHALVPRRQPVRDAANYLNSHV